MKKKAQVREVLQLHRVQRAPPRSGSAFKNLRAAPPLRTNAWNTTGDPSPNMADQTSAPIAKKRPLQGISNPYSCETVTEPMVKREKRATRNNSLLASNEDKKDVTQNISKEDFLSDGTSTEDEDLADPEEERQKEILWQAFSGRYAELTRPIAPEDSLGSEYSPSEKSVASSMVEASVGAPESQQMSDKPSGLGAAAEGDAVNPIEIDDD